MLGEECVLDRANNDVPSAELSMKHQKMELKKFMIGQVTKGIMQRYASLLVTLHGDITMVTGLNHLKTAKFLEIILHRAKSSHLQFKKVCCIVIKFLDCCLKETNYMRFLKFSLHKLFVAAFILSVPNVVGDDRDRITTRDEIYHSYSKITGLPLEEVINCCSIVRPVLIRRSRQQRKQMLPQHDQNSYFSRNTFTNAHSSATSFLSANGAGNNPLVNRHAYSFHDHSDGEEHDRRGMHDEANSMEADASAYRHTTFIPATPNILHSRSLMECGIEPMQTTDPDESSSQSNGYVLRTELQEFSNVGKRLVQESFRIV